MTWMREDATGYNPCAAGEWAPAANQGGTDENPLPPVLQMGTVPAGVPLRLKGQGAGGVYSFPGTPGM